MNKNTDFIEDLLLRKLTEAGYSTTEALCTANVWTLQVSSIEQLLKTLEEISNKKYLYFSVKLISEKDFSYDIERNLSMLGWPKKLDYAYNTLKFETPIYHREVGNLTVGTLDRNGMPINIIMNNPKIAIYKAFIYLLEEELKLEKRKK